MPNDRQDLLALAEQCEKATGPDQALDRDIRRLIQSDASPSNYTHSIDTAMLLAPEGWYWDVASTGIAWALDEAAMHEQQYGKGATPALALCAASLRARHSSQEADHA